MEEGRKSMRAFALGSFGDEGSIGEFDLPHPSSHEVRVKVLAASVNPVDWKTGKGYLKDFLEHRFPLVTGQDVAGIVDAVGAHVHDLREGDEVFGGHGQPFMGRGTHAEFVVANTAALAPKPAAIQAQDAASIPLAGVTALMAVDAIGASAGDTVVIVGASGGVGSFALQIAVERGARVIAVARAVNHEYLRHLGAAETISYETGDVVESIRNVHPEPVDGLIDLASDAATVRRLSALLRDGATVASPVGTAPMDDPRIKGVFIAAEINRARLEKLAQLIGNGVLQLPEIRTFELDDIGAAFRESEGGHVRGKLVVTP
jgi:NADPH:quinone reductase